MVCSDHYSRGRCFNGVDIKALFSRWEKGFGVIVGAIANPAIAQGSYKSLTLFDYRFRHKLSEIAFLISIVVTAVSLLIISKLLTGVEVFNPWIVAIAGAIIGAFNTGWHAWVRTINALVNVKLIPLLGSIIVVGLSAWPVEGFRLRWGVAIAVFGAIALSRVNSILFFILRQTELVAV